MADKEIIEKTEDDILDALLNDIDLDDKHEEIEVNVEDDILEDLEIPAEIERKLELEDTKREIYAAVEPTTTTVEAVEKKSGAAPKTKTVSSFAKKTRTSVDNLDAKHFVLLPGDEVDVEATKARVLAARPRQKKVGEKFDNLLTAVADGRKPSTYVVEAFGVLRDRGAVTSSDLVTVFRSHWGEGTSRSQVGQIMHLFDNLNIAKRIGSTLTLRADSVLAEKLGTVLDTRAA